MQKKKLYLIRHAKAEEYNLGKRDHDRDIVDKGKMRASQISKDLAGALRVTSYTLVISSTANRAMQTAELFCNKLNYPLSSIQQEKAIYEAFYLDILKVINKISDQVDTVLVFGHNPGLSDLTNYLTNSYIDLKTSHVAIIELETGIDFQTLSGGTATLKSILT